MSVVRHLLRFFGFLRTQGTAAAAPIGAIAGFGAKETELEPSPQGRENVKHFIALWRAE